MADFFGSLLNSKAGNSLYSTLSNKAGQALGGLDQPWRSAAGSIVNRIFPGFGGGAPDYRDNTYAGLLQQKLAYSEAEKEFYVGYPHEGFITEESKASVGIASVQKKYDWRARLRPKEGGVARFYSAIVGGKDAEGNDVSTEELDFLMRPIKESNGLVWQHTPSILLSGGAEYNSHMGQGMNYPINTYLRGQPMQIPVTADFSANNIAEARYILAMLIFLRVAIKGYYGDTAVSNGSFGTPPPVFVFEYLGDHGFNKVPVTVVNYQVELSDGVDYVPVQVNNTVTYVPTMTNVMITLQPHYTPQKMRRRFDVNTIANGAAYKDGFI